MALEQLIEIIYYIVTLVAIYSFFVVVRRFYLIATQPVGLVQIQPKKKFRVTSTICPDCKKDNLYTDGLVSTSVPPRCIVECYVCDKISTARIGECNTCSKTPVWQADGTARKRCDHGVWVELKK